MNCECANHGYPDRCAAIECDQIDRQFSRWPRWLYLGLLLVCCAALLYNGVRTREAFANNHRAGSVWDVEVVE